MTNVHALDPVLLLLGADLIGALSPQAKSRGYKAVCYSIVHIAKDEKPQKDWRPPPPNAI